jgi:hypothetical protein
VRCAPADPTIKYFNPPDTEGETYEGGRSLKELKKFAKSLGPGCSAETWSTCTEKQKAELQPYLDLPAEELAAAVTSTKQKIDAAQATHDELLKTLQSQFEESEKTLKVLKESLQPKLKLMRAAARKLAAPKDEV